MIHKRLTGSVPKSKKWILLSALSSWISLLCNVVITFVTVRFIFSLYNSSLDTKTVFVLLSAASAALIIRVIAVRKRSYFSYRAGTEVKRTLRSMLYDKFISLKLNYSQYISMAEVTQIGTDGIEQLDSYFGAYLPQFFFSMAAPVTLFIILAPINFFAALVLFVCVPLIPLSIAAIQTVAKRILKRYLDVYTGLGDSFLDNLRGLITLKAYSDDEAQHRELNAEAENFRRVTMRVLTMQLNSIFVMDTVAYGGTALGTIVSLYQLRAGNLSIEGTLLFILLCAEFFLPLRALGSFFHIAMNGITAANRLFELMDVKSDSASILSEAELEETAKKIKGSQPGSQPDSLQGNLPSLEVKNLNFNYNESKYAVKNASLEFLKPGFYGIAGESGSGKSTAAALLMGLQKNYSGEILLSGIEAKKLPDEFRAKYMNLVSTESFLFGASVRENLLIAKPSASDEELMSVLKKVLLDEFILNRKYLGDGNSGLDFYIESGGKNLSGGQIQRFALARALLHDTDIYIFDEAVSNIDVESEELILSTLYELSKTKIIIFISHRLANIENADHIYVFEKGEIKEEGTHSSLIEKNGVYARMYLQQKDLEKIRMGVK
ncbi:ABC transporter ATP-binding protein/permease [Treponema denticola]|uniref:ABC transporter ATP-binding protein/permease n=1 Tax=Treponema denticola TaxID=158 RepID=A0A9Q9BK69_TREDN|nr:ABC transporter ATP-binding protein/permease [Treponema denticola]UTC91323.1 ABC transporter ATP-binding protein/permease [Treponema denticola]UTC99323.1 ABC transporter ATP-binding protein/permease [Treponema denticola]